MIFFQCQCELGEGGGGGGGGGLSAVPFVEILSERAALEKHVPVSCCCLGNGAVFWGRRVFRGRRPGTLVLHGTLAFLGC